MMRSSATVLALFFLVGCYGMNSEDKSAFTQTSAQEDSANGKVDFNFLRLRVLEPKCIRCHADFSREKGILPFIVAGDPDSSQFFQSVQTGRMPQAGERLTRKELSVVRAYIKNLSSVVIEPPPVALEPTYTSLRVHLFERSCLRCHSGDNAKADVNLDSYQGIIDNLTDVIDDLEAGSMPPAKSSAPQPSDEVKAAFTEWVNQGTPEN